MLVNQVPVSVIHLLLRLESAGFEAVLVGGSVRDLIMGRPVHDFDVATSALPQDVKHLFRKTRDTGIAHGTVTVLEDLAYPVEVTTFRTESTYTDGRRPDKVSFGTSLLEDLRRRDFTINAIAMTARGEVVDPFSGAEDIRRGIVRAVGCPEERFQEDGLRILRAFRFAAVLGFQIEERTIAAMNLAHERLRAVSSERIGQEIMKIACSSWWLVLKHLAEGPWLDDMPNPMPYFRASLSRLETLPVHSVNRWYSVFPESQQKWRWQGSVATWLLFVTDIRAIAEKLFSALSWPVKDTHTVAQAAMFANEDLTTWSDEKWRRHLFENGQEPLRLAAVLSDWLRPSSNPVTRKFAEEVERQPIWSRKDIVLSGNDLTKLGLSGPEVGRAFELLVSGILAGDLKNDTSILESHIEQCLRKGVVHVEQHDARSNRHRPDTQ